MIKTNLDCKIVEALDLVRASCNNLMYMIEVDNLHEDMNKVSANDFWKFEEEDLSEVLYQLAIYCEETNRNIKESFK